MNLINKLRRVFFFLSKKLNIHGNMRTIFYDKWYARALKVESTLPAQGWTYVKSGKDRRVWRRGNVVLKIAYVESGIDSNYYERQVYRRSIGKNQEIKYAPCRLVSHTVLMMKAVRELDYEPEDEVLIPAWAYKLRDGHQVGIDNHGVIMAYDYADEMFHI